MGGSWHQVVQVLGRIMVTLGMPLDRLGLAPKLALGRKGAGTRGGTWIGAGYHIRNQANSCVMCEANDCCLYICGMLMSHVYVYVKTERSKDNIDRKTYQHKKTKQTGL